MEDDMESPTQSTALSSPPTTLSITLSFLSDENGELTLTGGTHRELAGCRAIGNDASHPCACAKAVDGSYLVFIGQPGEADWSALLEADKVVRAELLERDENRLLYAVIPTQSGENTVRFCDKTAGTALELPVTVDEALVLTVGDGQFTQYDYEKGRSEQREAGRKQAVESLVGTITLPSSLGFVSQNTSALLGENGTPHPLARIAFTYKEVAFVCHVSREVSEETLLASYNLASLPLEEFALSSGTAKLLSSAETAETTEASEQWIVWNSADGCLFWLTVPEGSVEPAKEAAKLLSDANRTLTPAA